MTTALSSPVQVRHCVLSFVAGAALAALVVRKRTPSRIRSSTKDDDNDDNDDPDNDNRGKPSRAPGAGDRLHAGATPEGEDLSLFYGDAGALTAVTPSRRFLPKDVYGRLVSDAVVCCVDIVLVRRTARGGGAAGAPTTKRTTARKECLLVERSSEPVRGAWWWPGGRLLKGETFFAAAIRKAREETGIPEAHVRPVQVLGVWNTFFPTSAWDTEASRGTQTVNPIVLVEISEDSDAEVKLDGTSESYRWIPLDPDLARGEDRYVRQALLRLRAWNPDYCEG